MTVVPQVAVLEVTNNASFKKRSLQRMYRPNFPSSDEESSSVAIWESKVLRTYLITVLESQIGSLIRWVLTRSEFIFFCGLEVQRASLMYLRVHCTTTKE